MDKATERAIKRVAHKTTIGVKLMVKREYQKMIRAEDACKTGIATYIDEFDQLRRKQKLFGTCVCITCGRSHEWNSGLIDAGHYLGTRNSVCFIEMNIHCQCGHCNRFASGLKNSKYAKWMEANYPEDELSLLQQLNNQSVSFSKEGLVVMRLAYTARLKAAKEILQAR